MPMIDTAASCPIHDSFRVRQVAGMFDLPVEETSAARFAVEVPGLDEPWQVGAIVGPSGSGKSTVARAAFGEAVQGRFDWPADRAVIDCLGEGPIKRVTQTLTAVGFSSPPAWLKPYAVLSGGEQFRCDLARALLGEKPLVVFDEFTSVVDRAAARIGSAAVGRAVRREGGPEGGGGEGESGRRGDANITLSPPLSFPHSPPRPLAHSPSRFVAVTCHYDVLEWLEPDWFLDMATRTLHRRRLRRPPIELAIFRCERSAWRLFGPHHYLSGSLPPGAVCYLASWNDAPAAFCAVLAVPGRAGERRVSRIVVLPDYQGVGVGRAFLNAVAELHAAQGQLLRITTSHPAMIAALARSPDWRLTAVKKTGYGVQSGARRGRLNNYVKGVSLGRGVVSFRYGKLKIADCKF